MHIPFDQVLDGMPLSRCWALRAWCLENSPWGMAENVTLAYVGQEVERIKRNS